MALHDDFLAEVQRMTSTGAVPPPACLRRAVSTAYYALYHLLMHDAARETVQTHIYSFVARSIDHKTVLKYCEEWLRGNYSDLVKSRLSGALETELRSVMQAFVDLYKGRIEADYDEAKAFSEIDARRLVEMAAAAFQDWGKVKATTNARLFLTVLLFEKVRRL